MPNILLIILFHILWITSAAQPVNNVSESHSTDTRHYEILPDRGYTVQKIISDTSLPFSLDDSVRLSTGKTYWLKLKIINPKNNSVVYDIAVWPYVKNTLYYYDAEQKKWTSYEAGILRTNQRRINQLAMSCTLQGASTNTLFIKVDMSAVGKSDYVIKPKIKVEPQAINSKSEQTLWMVWLAGITVLTLFFLNNLYVYLSFRNRSILYYLIAQLGGMLYITTYWRILYAVLPIPVFTVALSADGTLYYYNANHLLMHVGIVCIIYGMVQLTRSFLNTQRQLPQLDVLLKYSMYMYLLFSLVLAVINTIFFELEYKTMLLDNLVFLLIFLLIIYTSMVAYLKKFPASGPFLLASLLPLVFTTATALFHLVSGVISSSKLWFPQLAAIISQALAFSITLVAHNKYIQNNLRVKELEARQLMFDIKEIALRHQIIEMENKLINANILQEKTRNEELQQRLEANQRELASTTMYMAQKNEMLAKLKTQIQELTKKYPDSKYGGLQSIESILQSNQYLDEDWARFRIHFEEVHPHFFEELLAKHPGLTRYEIRLYAYFHINLSTKEIAALLNIDPASVRRAKTRLLKKMAIREPQSEA